MRKEVQKSSRRFRFSGRSLTCAVTIASAKADPTGRRIRQIISKAVQILKAPLREITIVIVDDAEMSALHKRFMGDATTTDVMTFPIDIDALGRAISGEVYVCIPEARRQAKVRKTTVEREVVLYALHGLLHLCGFDDRTPEEYRRMHRREDQILTRLGVGPVFAPADRPKKRRHA